jgi:hypothetical protein
MMPLAIEAMGMQPAAMLLLVLYLAAVLILLPRELAFLRDVKSIRRWWFIVQDVLLQASILLVLVPCAISKQLDIGRITVVATGFLMLWVVAVWMIVARQRYVHQMLRAVRDESDRQIKELHRSTKLKEEKRNE